MWLLKQEVLLELQRLASTVTSEQQTNFVAACEAEARVAASDVLTVADGTATIVIEGILTKKPDFLAFLFGGGNMTFAKIDSLLAAAANDASVKRVLFDIDSPGGTVAGLFETLAVLEAFPKPMSVVASNAQSGAFAFAAVAGKIQAKTAASTFGSVGVATRIFTDEALVDITSTEAPDKRPDVTTEEGKAVIRKELDAIHDLFVGAIARGRGTTAKKVNADFGRGATLLAGDARKAGMIDKLPRAVRSVRAEGTTEPIANGVGEEQDATADPGGAPIEKVVKTMTKDEFKAQHPELYAAVHADGVTEGEAKGVIQGTAEEKKRVCAHLKMAESTGATKVAMDAIESGADLFDQSVHADYMSAALNRSDQTDRQGDAAGATAALDGADPVATDKDFGDRVADALEAQNGVA